MRLVMQGGPDLQVVHYESRAPHVGVIKFSDHRKIKYHPGHENAEDSGLIIPTSYKGLSYVYSVGPEHVEKARKWLAVTANPKCPQFHSMCTVNRRLSDALGHDPQGHKALAAIIRHRLEKPFVRMSMDDFSAVRNLGSGGIRRALLARNRIREGKV